jgi:hypothetical protein
MLLSVEHRFIFIHIYKTAGTSVTHALRPFTSDSHWARAARLLHLRRTAIPDHVTARALRDLIDPALFEGCFKFAFVRNPWDWQVSLYHYMQQSQRHPQHHLVAGKTFDEYLQWRIASDRQLQKTFVTDESGKLIVDFVGRFETLTDDCAHIFERIGISTRLPHRNRSRRGDYRRYYNTATRALVAEHFREDIDMFDYSFE